MTYWHKNFTNKLKIKRKIIETFVLKCTQVFEQCQQHQLGDHIDFKFSTKIAILKEFLSNTQNI